MHTKTLIALLLMALIAGGAIYFQQTIQPESEPMIDEIVANIDKIAAESTPQSIAYEIDGITYTLVDGKAIVAVTPDATSVNTLTMFGEPTYGDLDNDGDTDAAVLLSLTTGGSGTFYYAVLALSTSYGYRSTNALYLGDRIAPQTVGIEDGRAVFNYVVRHNDEPMTTQPSIGKSLYIHLDPKKNEIGEFVKNFEGEVDTAQMSLTTKPWTWVRTEYTDKPAFISAHTSSFILTFKNDNTFGARTDCNGVGGEYTSNGSMLALTKMMSTLMYCEGSDESTFSGMLGEVTTYSFGPKGELMLKNITGNSAMIFQ